MGTSVKQLVYVKLHWEIWKVFSPRGVLWPACPACPPWPAVCWRQQWPAPGRRKNTLWFPPQHTRKAVSCVGLFPILVLGLNLLHGVKTLRVAQKAKLLLDQNRRWRLRCYAFPTQCMVSLPVLGGRCTTSLNDPWLTWRKQSLKFSWVLSSPCCGNICWKISPEDWKGRRAEPSPPPTTNLQFLQPLETFQASPGTANKRGKGRRKGRWAALCTGQSHEAELQLLSPAKHSSC